MNRLLGAICAALLALASVPAFAQTGTTNYGWLKPTIGASANTWGNNLNSDLDGIDSTVFGVSGVANAAMPKAGGTYTGKVTWAAAVAAYASANCPNGAAPTAPVTGDLWCVGGNHFTFDGTTTHQFAYLDSSITGNAATATTTTGNAGTATKLQTARSIGTSGDINCSATNFDGSANITLPNCNMPNVIGGFTAVGDSSHTWQLSADAKGRITGATQVPISLSQSQVLAMLGLASSGNATIGSLTVPTANGNIILNWGFFSAVGGNSDTITATYTTQYSSGVIAFCGGTSGIATLSSASTSQIVCHNNGGGVQNVNWFTIGK